MSYRQTNRIYAGRANVNKYATDNRVSMHFITTTRKTLQDFTFHDRKSYKTPRADPKIRNYSFNILKQLYRIQF